MMSFDWPNSSWVRYSTRVVTKLRIAFFSIVVVIIIAFVLSGRTTSDLESNRSYALHLTLPALVLSQTLANILVQSLETIEHLKSEISPRKLTRITDKLHRTNVKLQQVKNEIELKYKSLYINFEEIKQDITELGNIIQKLVRLEKKRLSLVDVVYKVRDQVIDNRRKIESYNSSIYSSDKVKSYISRSGYIDPENKRWLVNNTRNSESVSYLFGMHVSPGSAVQGSIYEEIEHMVKHFDAKKFELLKEELSADIQEISQFTSEVQSEGASRESVDALKSMAEIIREQITIAQSIVEISELEKDRGNWLSSQSQITGRISSVMNLNASHIDMNTHRLSHWIEETQRTTRGIVIVLNGFVVGIVFLLLFVVVERQFNRRMNKLTAAVNAVADGDVDYAVDMSGEDEIGKMADALEIFRVNARELKRSNDELQQFAYAASHDLKSPMNSIKILAEWIREDSSDLSFESSEHLDLLILRVQRLSAMQTDLLEYAKAGHGHCEILELDLAAMIHELSGFLDPKEMFSISVSVDSIVPTLKTQIVPLRQILLNLIHNSIKHSDSSEGTIVVSMDLRGSRLRFKVKDNGPGIDPKYHEVIFGVFKTLRSKDEVEGTGLGLSLVRKLIERNNGSITVNSKLGSGTEFVFDWPVVL